ncbi:TSUP family transporter, partial [candidate division WWE3 bacterium]|nr:TSUP family transporter [candidate division WWE3 bacterium]
MSSLIGTMTGFGSSTIMLPVLLIFYSVPEALLFSAIVHVLVDIWEMEFFKQGLYWKLVLFFGLPGMLASFFGASLAVDLPEVI